MRFSKPEVKDKPMILATATQQDLLVEYKLKTYKEAEFTSYEEARKLLGRKIRRPKC